MKKTLMIAFTIIGLYACKKEITNNVSIEPKNTKGIIDNKLYPEVSVVDGVLAFSSINYFESLVTNDSESYEVDGLTSYLQLSTFNSYGKKYGEQSEYDEPFMDAIMNEDKIVKIGEWFIYIDLPSETVLALSDDEENAYSSLLDKSNSHIKKFSVGDDVLEHLLNNTDPNAEGCGGIGGGTYPCYPSPETSQIVKTYANGNVWRLDPFVKFFRSGVFFKLSSQFQVYRFTTATSSSGGQALRNIESGDIEVQMFIRYQGWWKKRPCRSNSIGTHSGGYHFSESIYGKGKRTVYSGTRNLNGYYLYVQGRVKYEDGTYTIASPYGGRNVNSPY